MNTEALKEQARRHEQREEWVKAIDMYAKAVDQLASDDQPDLSLYNRLGDLEIRVGNVERGVEYYEQAIDLYVEAELPNNAIAICRKVVRNLPTRHPIFLKMGQIRARQGFLTDARTNFLEYAERMQKAQDLEEAFRALIEFVDLAPEDIEARMVLAAQLEAHERSEESVEQYIAIHQRLTAKDRLQEAESIEEKIRALDPARVIPGPERPVADTGAVEDSGLVGFETTALIDDFPTLEPTADPSDVAEVDTGEFEIAADLSDDIAATESDSAVGESEGAPTAFQDPLALDEADSGSEEPPIDYGMPLAPAEPGDEAGSAVGSDIDIATDFGVADSAAGEPGPDPVEANALQWDPADEPDPPSVTDEDPLSGLSTAPVELAPWAVDRPVQELETPDPEAEEASDLSSEEPDSASVDGPDDWRDDEEPSTSDPLPLISFEDDESENAGTALDASDASDFGVRDDPGRDQEYLEPVSGIPELDVALTDMGDAEHAPQIPDAPETADGSLVLALQRQLEADPDNGDTWLALAQEFFGLGRADEATLAADEALARFDTSGDMDGSIRTMRTLSTEEPDVVAHRQRLVELAVRKNDEAVLTAAYVDLADCLVRTGDGDLARAVYQQVLTLDPSNEAANEGLGSLDEEHTAPAREVASSEDYVDLGSLILDDDEKTTRWKVAAEEPSGDEAADFAKMLAQFKDKVAENLEADDLAAHYDLGTAYKEMGLVDEAIYEFQQALRAEADHLPTHELLGQCFMEKGQFEVAVRSMNRALDSATEVEDELLGIYYQMARAHEELGNKGDALEFYEKVFALDINFQDVTERLRVLR